MPNTTFIIVVTITLLVINGIAILFKLRNLLENYDMLKTEYYSQINLSTLFNNKQKIIPQDEFSNKEISKIRKLLIREFALLLTFIGIIIILLNS